MTTTVQLTAQQKMALMVMESQAKLKTSLDFFNELTALKLPSEVITIFKDLSLKTINSIANKTIEIGKIIIMKILEFIKTNPGLSIGMAIGGALGALTVFIPFIGVFIAPISTSLGIVMGGLVGNSIQRRNEGINTQSDIAGTVENAIDIAKKFFQLLKDIFLAIFRPEDLR